MRILPKRPGHNHHPKPHTKGSLHHRSSWHVGHNPSPPTSRNKGHRTLTWHFPRLSLHSMHNNSSHSPRPHNEHDDDDDDDLDTSHHNKHVPLDFHLGGKRKTFSYAVHAQEEAASARTTTRPPLPLAAAPDEITTETEILQCHCQASPPLATTTDHPRKDHKRHKPFRFLHNVFKGLFWHGSKPQSTATATTTTTKKTPTRVRGGVLLQSCQTAEEQRAKVQEIVEISKRTYGEKGLQEAGFEYRMVPCPQHAAAAEKEKERVVEITTSESIPDSGLSEILESEGPEETDNDDDDDEPQQQSSGVLLEVQETTEMNPEQKSHHSSNEENATTESTQAFTICHHCAHRLFHIESNTPVTSENRKLFIADGDMYDAVSKLCQENAHQVMQRKYGLVWRTLCPPEVDDNPMKQNKDEPIRALVNPEQMMEGNTYYRKRPTLLIVTGKGKVRAGIFSRQHMMVTGMESSTALPLIQEARKRQLNLVIIDPNCHGDRVGMNTFQKSMEKAFEHWEKLNNSQETTKEPCCRDLYILSHSASGSQLVRYLLEKSKYYLPHIRAIAFTDATHNVQWARQRGNQPLLELLESPACIYFRCANPDKDCDWAKHRAGDAAPTDGYWRHRFGKVKTCWAGTKEHSLTNWFAHGCIWEHFDKILGPINQGRFINTDGYATATE